MSDTKKPILSICIPTYNRAESLNAVLMRYVENPEFDEQVELVISDNASTDSTMEICQKYTSLYPNIKYFRNKENIHDKNFSRVLNCAKGLYLKLLNDYVYFNESALRYVKSKIIANLDQQPTMFFTSGYVYNNVEETCLCESLDEYFQIISIGLTNNNMFGAWKKDWDAVVDKEKYAALKLMQVDWSCQIVTRSGRVTLFNESILNYCPAPKMFRGSYNWFKVHLDNYYTILTPYYRSGSISHRTLKRDRKILIKFYRKRLCHIYLLRKDIGFDTDGTWKYFLKYYARDLYFYWFIVSTPIWFISQKIESAIKILYSKIKQ